MSLNKSFGADYEFYAISNFNFAGMKAYGSLVSGFCKLLTEATSFAGKMFKRWIMQRIHKGKWNI